MSEFTKLGGYLVQGQPEIAHDSALSGNGLPESPLGISEQFITDVVRPNTQSAMNLNIGHPTDNTVSQVGTTIGAFNNANNTGMAVGTSASAFNKSIAVGDNVYANNIGIAVGYGVRANNIAAFGTYNSETNTDHDCIFVVGNGTDSANRSDAFEVYTDGRVKAANFVTTNNVQLSALTGVSEANDLVHSNSGTWNGVSAKLDTTAFSDVSGSFLTAVPDTYLQNTDLEISDNKITGISGIPLSAGGDVPEGVMVESGLEFNAVNEISGYNGSAIAQYGAEKQWLTHDDTIVHVSNSAQYAFGVNLSGISADLARMLGVDETLLYSGELGAIGGNITINEPMSNFNKIGVYMAPGVTDNPAMTYYPTETLSPSRIAFRVQWAYNYIQDAFIKLVPTGNDVTFKYDGNTLIQYKHNASGVTTIINDTAYILTGSKLRIYGIGRKN